MQEFTDFRNINHMLQATVEQHPEKMGYEGVVVALELIQGKTAPSQKMIQLDLITKSTLQ